MSNMFSETWHNVSEAWSNWHPFSSDSGPGGKPGEQSAQNSGKTSGGASSDNDGHGIGVSIGKALAGIGLMFAGVLSFAFRPVGALDNLGTAEEDFGIKSNGPNFFQRAADKTSLAIRDTSHWLEDKTRSVGQKLGWTAPDEASSTIIDAANANGADAGALLTIAKLESNYQNVDSHLSSAVGRFQITRATAKFLGIDAHDPTQNARGAAMLWHRSEAALSGIEATKEDGAVRHSAVYVAHMFGIGGSTKLYTNPNARAIDLLGTDAVRNNLTRADINANPDWRNMTASDLTHLIESRYNDAEGKVLTANYSALHDAGTVPRSEPPQLAQNAQPQPGVAGPQGHNRNYKTLNQPVDVDTSQTASAAPQQENAFQRGLKGLETALGMHVS